MPVLCDFTVIRNADDAPDRIFTIGGGSSDSRERHSLRLPFNTGGRHESGGALLMFSVRGLNRTEESPQVRINGTTIGDIGEYTPESHVEDPDNSNFWYDVTLAFDATLLNDGDGLDNTLEITSVPTNWQDIEGTQENFNIRNIICYFHQRDGSDSSWVDDLVSGVGDVVTGVVDAVTTVVNAVVEVFDSTLGWLISGVAFFAELVFSIPVLGRLLKWLWNIALTGFWGGALGLVDFVAALVGIMPEKKLRICVIILRDEAGEPLDTAENLVPQLQNTIDILRREANVRVIPAAPFQFDSGFASPEEATEDWVHIQGRGRNESSVLDVDCGPGAAVQDLGTVGGRFEILASTTCLYSNGRRVMGYGAPVIIFIVRSVGGPDERGCSLGPLSDYVTVEAGGSSASSVIAHELGHACNLLHVDDRDNLMKSSGRRDTRLSRFQAALLRTSRHVTYS
jgi:hypothetical protein